MFAKKTDIPKEHVGRVNATSGIIIDGVTKDYGNGTLAVKPTYLKIERGEFFSLLGSSGSGKTTTLKMLSGLEYPTTGKITLEGVDITTMPANRRDVHTVFQNYALFPHMTVAKNVAYGLEGRKMDKRAIEKHVSDMLELVDLKGHENDKPGELSGGMQQRVALARALVLEPKTLLLDEPLGALDLKLRHHMQRVLRDIHKEVGITFVYVTHDQEEAFSMSDRIGVMTKGELVQVSTPEELYLKPKTKFVAGFVGASNFIKGTIEGVVDEKEGVYSVRFHELSKTATVHGIPYLHNGNAVAGVIRPQNIWLESIENAENANLLSCRMCVTDRTFLGSHSRVSLKAGAFELTANPTRIAPALADAAEVRAVWSPDDVWVVADR